MATQVERERSIRNQNKKLDLNEDEQFFISIILLGISFGANNFEESLVIGIIMFNLMQIL